MHISSKIKSNNFFRSMYKKILLKMYKSEIIPDDIPTKIQYRVALKEKLDLKNPRKLNEKIQWLKLNYKNELIVKCTDKLLVREYIKDKGLSNILNELYDVYEKISDINYNQLPNYFVLKGTRNGVLFHTEKQFFQENLKEFEEDINQEEYGISNGEKHYQRINQKILVEKFLKEERQFVPLDYKIFSFHGEPTIITVYERKSLNEITDVYSYDFEWNPLSEYMSKENNTDPEKFKKPDNLSEIYKISKKLSQPFPFVRVDLYNVKNEVIFGELTFTPGAGLTTTYSEKGQIELGDKISLQDI